MKPCWLGAILIAVILGSVGCGDTPNGGPIDSPNEVNLRQSFADQIRAIPHVTEFMQNQDELFFYRVDGAGEKIRWLVRITSTSVDPGDGDTTSPLSGPIRGTVVSSWSANNRRIVSTGNVSNLPMWILDRGISQDCWALWDDTTQSWGWL